MVYAQQSDFEEFVQRDQQAFQNFRDAEARYLEEISREYETYVQQQQEAFEAFREEVERKWDQFRYPTKEEYVDYDDDLEGRGSVNFDEGKVEIEVLTEADDPDADSKARERVRKKMEDLVRTTDNEGRSILEDQLDTGSGKPVDETNVGEYAREVVDDRAIQTTSYTARDGKQRRKYTVTVPLVPDHLAKRASRYKAEVMRQSDRFNLDPPLIFAVMQTESYFNPKARSYVPAFGLMQLVPQSGARDAYIFVYKRDTLLTADYLYIPRNNIELGCAYLSKLRNVYFKEITDDSSAYYCAIAAYNTGPGNVARALTGTKRLGPTVRTVNTHNYTWVYDKLMRDLPYDETKGYLKKVLGRVAVYESWRE